MYVNGPEPLAIVIDAPSTYKVAPFQPSPHESVAVSWQSVPTGAGAEPEKGLPPERVVPSTQLSDQPTSPGYEPPDTVMAPLTGAGAPAAAKVATKVRPFITPINPDKYDVRL